jgi:hypothetical protein
MKHDSLQPPPFLLTEISRDLHPVKAAPVPSRLALRVLPLVALAALAALVLLARIGLHGDLAALGPLLAWGISSVQIGLGILLVWIAARESTPARRLPGNLVVSAALATWFLLTAVALWTFAVNPTVAPGGSAWRLGLFCGVAGTVAGGLLVTALAWFFRHSLAARPALAGALYGAGAGVAVNAGWRLACPISTPWHSLTAHGGAIIATTILGAVASHVMAKRMRGPVRG